MAHPVVLQPSCHRDGTKRASAWRSRVAGRARTIGNRVYPKRVSRVQIPPSPPIRSSGNNYFYVVSRTFSLFVNFTECTESCIHFFRIVCRKSCRPGAICFQLFGFFCKPVYKLLSSDQFSSEYKSAHGNSISCINQQRGIRKWS